MLEVERSDAKQTRGFRGGFLQAALVALLFLDVQTGTMAQEGYGARIGSYLYSRDVFFSDYFLFSAQSDVMSMATGERVALGALLERCVDSLSATQASRLRCEMTSQQYLIDYRRDRPVDRLLDATQFMTSLIQYNMTIGRENEAGFDNRIRGIHRGLNEALRIIAPIAADTIR